ncbi:nucleotide exchange factor GrpE [Dokdonella fugitiva]|jgi:molecular chaperone GrpE|uniref:Protein GrpE n=1 Tax=Dokdonella fugitiva TaxID=328517 RepID=A0A4R2HU02_9GAMM|nr:nucleotide exchange factor GrpE [Dokdonella fugitiva]MBA8884906.1 molecular chaperone GrpE [Dokdonella fugitiva]TCO34834.1 molecular chaperone GrpE [Dokdonella fugitiva]
MQSTDPNATPQAPAGNDQALEGELETLSRQLGEAETKLAEMRETVLRERAELDNQRKRLQRDLEQARRFANEKLLADLLPVVDNLERGLAAEGSDAAALRAGVELTLRELGRVVEGNGLRAVGVVGEAFDPERHQAMSLVEAAELGSGKVVAVMQKGYLLNDRLLRPALVSVSK